MIDTELKRNKRWIKEAIWIRKATPVMYRDEGGYRLSHVLGRLTCQDNRRAEEELAFPEFLMKAADGSRNVE